MPEKLKTENFPTGSEAAKRINKAGGTMVANLGSNNVYIDGDGRYWVAVGPNVINENAGPNTIADAEEKYGTKLYIVVEDDQGNIFYIPAVLGDVKIIQHLTDYIKQESHYRV